jgi:squalene-associated FAD-dependent desaturase
MRDVTIIGGGLAGLSAAVALSEKGVKVSLFERRPLLGGRAYSVKDATTGDTLDNGQHLFMGCYHHTFRFLEKIGTLSKLQFQEKMRVDFADPEGKTYQLQCPNLPAPFHLLAGLLKLKTLSWGEKWALLRMMGKVKKLSSRELESLDQLSCEQWLTLLDQSDNTIQRFWEPIIIGTINELPRLASAKMLAVVIREALLKDKKDSLMVLSTVGLSDLYTEAAQDFIEKHGGQVFTRRGVARMSVTTSANPGASMALAERVDKMLLEDGSEQRSDFYLSAIPPDALLSLFGNGSDLLPPGFEAFKEFQFSPILSINLWFDQPILSETFVGLLESPIHWVFSKGALLKGSKNYFSLVISAAHDLKDLGQDALVTLALKELHRAIPSSKSATLKHSRILKELKATPCFTVGMESFRPQARTSFKNLFLAGDWTATGLPATMEGAVKSGELAAQLILEEIGKF